MEFFTFLLFIAIIFLYTSYSTLKRNVTSIQSDLERNLKQNRFLKDELEKLKNLIDGKQIISTEEIVVEKEPIIEKISEIIEPITASSPEIESSLEISAKENSADFMAITDILLPKDSIINVSETVPAPTPIAQKEIPTVQFEHQKIEPPKKVTPKEPEVYVESAFSKLLKKLEAQFAENWTGILGTGIMVLGIGYLSIYTAMKVSPLFRILLIWLYAGLLMGSYYLLQKKEQWEKTGLWLRSAGASLFLFGCFGASQIDALHFIDNQGLGYLLIGLGIALNLYIGYIIKKQTFLSLHVALSMLILCVVPDKMLLTFILASLTATAGIILSYKEKWEYHLLTVIVSFLLFDIWFNSGTIGLSKSENIIAILGILLVFASCLLMQYRSVYENTKFEKAAFITHLSNWILFASGLLMHSTGNHLKTFIIMAGSVICFFLALHARKKKIIWLYHLDGMISFLMLFLSVILLNDWKVGLDIIFCILYAITLLSLFVVYKEKEVLLHKIFLVINHVLGLFLVGFVVFESVNLIDSNQITNSVATTIILSVIGVSFVIYNLMKQTSPELDSFYLNKKYSLNGLIAIAFSVFSIVLWDKTFGNNSYFYALIGFALLWTFLKQKFNTHLFDLGRILFLIMAIVFGSFIFESTKKSITDLVFGTLLLGTFAYNWKLKDYFEKDFLPRFLAILGTNTILVLASFKYITNSEIQILSLFLIALLNHEFLWFNFKKKSLSSQNQYVLYVFYYFLIGLGSLALVVKSEHFKPLQIGFTCLGILVVETYVLFAHRFKNKANEETKQWTNFNLLNSEFILFTILVFCFQTYKLEYNTAILALLSVLTFIGFQKFSEFKRYQNYSFLFLLFSAFFTVGLSFAEFKTLSKTSLYLTQIISIVLGIIYCYLSQKDTSEKSKSFSVYATYLLNIWIVVLLFVQVQLVYLSVILMSLALLNYYLIFKEKIAIKYTTISILCIISMGISLFFSFFKLNGFTILDWVLQLSSVIIGLFLAFLINKNRPKNRTGYDYQIVLNAWLSVIMFSQLPHKWLPVYWAAMAILTIYFYHKQITKNKFISIVYYLLANIHLGFLSFNLYESKYLIVYLLIFALLGIYIYLAYKWLEVSKFKNSLLVYPATISIACFLYLTFDKGILTLFWILESLGLLILSLALKEKYFRYVSLSFVAICVVRLMFFDLSNADFLVRALVLLGVGVVLILMNTLFKKYKGRFD